MKDEKPVGTSVNEALNKAMTNGDDFVNAEEYVEGEIPVADTPIFAEAANQEVAEEVQVDPVEVEPVLEEDNVPDYTTEYSGFDEINEFAQPSEKKSNVIPVVSLIVAFAFLIGICFMALSSKDNSIKSFLRIDTPDKEEVKEVKEEKEDNTPINVQSEEQQEETLVVEEPKKTEEPKTNKPSGKTSSGSSSSSNSGTETEPIVIDNGGNSNSQTGGNTTVTTVTHYAYIDVVDGMFNARAKVTRHELAKMIVKLNNITVPNKLHNYYDDVDSSTEDYRYINTAAAKGYLDLFGTSGNFNPNANVHRDEMVAVLIYMLHKNNIPIPNNCSGSEGNTFNDIDDSPYKIYLMEAGNNCITAGTGAHVFSPNDEINRGHIATLVSRLLGRENSKHDCVEPDVPPFSDFDKKDVNYYRRIDAVLTRECTK